MEWVVPKRGYTSTEHQRSLIGILSCWSTVSDLQPGLLGSPENSCIIKQLHIPTALVDVRESRGLVLPEAIRW
jgi:hypothetical protein